MSTIVSLNVILIFINSSNILVFVVFSAVWIHITDSEHILLHLTYAGKCTLHRKITEKKSINFKLNSIEFYENIYLYLYLSMSKLSFTTTAESPVKSCLM